MRNLIEKLAIVLLKPVNEIVTFLLGGYTILWGLWLTAPWFDVFSHAALYSVLSEFIPYETVWGLFAIVAGGLTMAGAVANLPRSAFMGCGASTIHWFIITIFYFMGDVASTGGITSLFICSLAAYLYLNKKVQWDYEHYRMGSRR